jgi:hypothetical protein
LCRKDEEDVVGSGHGAPIVHERRHVARRKASPMPDVTHHTAVRSDTFHGMGRLRVGLQAPRPLETGVTSLSSCRLSGLTWRPFPR